VNDESTSDDGRTELLNELSGGANELQALVATQPTTEEEIVAVLTRRLSGPITPDTWNTILGSLTSYLGEDAFYVFGWAVTSDPGDETRLEMLAEVGGPEVVGLARRIMAQFGEELRYAYEISGQLADNWRLVNREVYRDLINSRYFMRIHVEKYGGEKIVVEGPPDSILSLTTFILGALRYTGDAGAFSQNRVEEFVSAADEFLDLLRTSAEEVVVGDGDAAGPDTES
jgi:hypothetical protein